MLNPIDPIKIIVHKDRILKAIEGKIPPPVTVGLDISNFCNHNCIWCLYERYKKEHRYNMPKKLIHKAIKEMKVAKVLGVCISGGGDPGMNPHLDDAILFCEKLGLNSSLNTNGSLLHLLSKEAIQALTYIRISLDAGSEKTHIKLHKPLKSDFKKILKNIEKISKRKLTMIGVGFLAHSENCKEIYQLSKILSDIGCKYLQVRPLKNVCLQRIDKERVFQQIKKAKEDFSIQIFESFSKMSDTIERKQDISTCYMNRLVSSISPDGYVYPCCELRGHHSLGNIKDRSFASIWYSKEHCRFLKRLNVKNCPPCKYAKGNEYIERIFMKDELHRNFI